MATAARLTSRRQCRSTLASAFTISGALITTAGTDGTIGIMDRARITTIAAIAAFITVIADSIGAGIRQGNCPCYASRTVKLLTTSGP